MKISEFDFKLASTRTAVHQAENRDESRLMIVHKDTGKIEHKQFMVGSTTGTPLHTI